MRSEKRRDLHCERWRLAFYRARSWATYVAGHLPRWGRHWAKIPTTIRHLHMTAGKMTFIHHHSGALPAARLSEAPCTR